MRHRKSKFPDPQPGDVFDYYTVKEYNKEESERRKRKIYNVQCVCGNIRTAEKFDLINHRATNCGCIANAKKRDDEDISGQKFGRWTAIEKDIELSKSEQHTMWKCRCDCNTERSVNLTSLKKGYSKSCGCIEKENAAIKALEREKTMPYHKELKSRYRSMKSRCYDPKNIRYPEYGGRGIEVCDRWMDSENGFLNFYHDMYSSDFKTTYTLDRINVNGNYCPENCRWITLGEQGCNTRTNNIHEYYGMEICASRLSEFNNSGIDPVKLRNIINDRINNGWTIREAINKPIGGGSKDKYFEMNPLVTKPFIFTYDIPEDLLRVVKIKEIDYEEERRKIRAKYRNL